MITLAALRSWTRVSEMQITLCDKPVFQRKKLSPQQQAGLCYERKVFKFFRRQKNLFPLEWKGDLLHSPWFRSCEAGKVSFYNPDVLLVGPEIITVFECKLSQNELAEAQLRQYGRVCLEFFALPINLICCFRNLYRPTKLITNLSSANQNQQNNQEISQWHIFL